MVTGHVKRRVSELGLGGNSRCMARVLITILLQKNMQARVHDADSRAAESSMYLFNID